MKCLNDLILSHTSQTIISQFILRSNSHYLLHTHTQTHTLKPECIHICKIDGETGETGEQCQTLFFWAPKSLQMVTAAMKLKDAYSLEGKL